MKNSAQLLFLGTGGSLGVPVVGCKCPVCTSENSYNQRTRSSLLLKVDSKHFLVDCSPDFRMQALRHNIKSLDGILFTHAHYDHTAGIDELRALTLHMEKPLPCLMCPETYRDIKHRFYYIFGTDKQTPSFRNKYDIHLLPSTEGETEFLGLNVRYMSFEQAKMRVTGFRFGNLAYISDIRDYKEDIFNHLQGLDTLVISALRFLPSPMHFSIDEAVSFIQKSGAKKAWLMHLAHEVDHDRGNAYLPENIRLSYDGLEIDFCPG